MLRHMAYMLAIALVLPRLAFATICAPLLEGRALRFEYVLDGRNFELRMFDGDKRMGLLSGGAGDHDGYAYISMAQLDSKYHGQGLGTLLYVVAADLAYRKFGSVLATFPNRDSISSDAIAVWRRLVRSQIALRRSSSGITRYVMNHRLLESGAFSESIRALKMKVKRAKL